MTLGINSGFIASRGHPGLCMLKVLPADERW